jgi:hypothetical protein
VGMGSIGLREVRGVEAPKASRADFTGVTVPQASHPVLQVRMWN